MTVGERSPKRAVWPTQSELEAVLGQYARTLVPYEPVTFKRVPWLVGWSRANRAGGMLGC